MKRILQTLATLVVWLACCAFLAVVALGFCGYFD